jgi:high-affinity Fe2+/Pb2+ permease
MNPSQDIPLPKTKKSKLQKSSLYFAAASIVAAIASVIYLFLKIDTLGWENPISASLLASTFFFVFVALILVVIGTTNIPSFKFEKDSD